MYARVYLIIFKCVIGIHQPNKMMNNNFVNKQKKLEYKIILKNLINKQIINIKKSK